MFDAVMQECLHKANVFTRKNKNEFITLEHFVWACLKGSELQNILKELGKDSTLLIKELEEFVDKIHPKLKRLSSQYNPEPSLALHRSIERALRQAQSAGKNRISSLHVLISIFEEDESFALYLLEKNGITPLILMEELSHKEGEESSNTTSSPLEKFCEDLNLKYEKGKAHPFVGRSGILNRILEVLARKTKNNPLLVGDPGVGKTALGEGLAELSVEEKLPEKFKNLRVFSLDLAALLAGSKYRGDFEARMKSLLKNLNEVENPLLYIDEIHSIVGAGTTSGSNVDFASLLKPSLSDSHIKIVGTTTYDEYRKHFAKDAALSRRFQSIFVDEPSQEEAIKILEGTKKSFEDFHALEISQEALKACVKLSAKHIPDRKLPDKAFDLLDETCAHESTIKNNFKITPKEIKQSLKRLYKIRAEESVEKGEHSKVLNLKTDLKSKVFGQDQAIDELYSSILVAYSGLKSKNRPLGSFLFTGPTGVGKTELSKQLAQSLDIPFIKFDMSEYMEKHSVSRLIGSPPGYVGHEEGGRLTDEVSKHPHSVLLLDEVEKAHPDVINILLQVMDAGVLTDSIGKKTYFNNCIIIMTSNSGAREADKGSIGIFDAPSADFSDKAIKSFFSPEFLNRLTAIVGFRSLDKKLLLKVVDKELASLKEELENKSISLDYNKDLLEWIYKKAYQKSMGARPFERFIDRHLRTKIAENLIKKPKSKKITLGLNSKQELEVKESD